MTQDQTIIFGILAATIVLFPWGRWRHDVVALASLLACVFAGLVPVESAFVSLGHPAVITVACVLVLSSGLQVQGGFIVGFDSDTPALFQRQIEFIQQSGIVTAMVGLLNALPGTGLYERMKRENRLRSDSTGDNVSASTNIVPRMGLEAIQEGYKRILRTIYSPENYYRRMKDFLQDYHPRSTRSALSIHYKLAGFHSLYRLGLLGRERRHFWRVLLWTLFHRPCLIREAVTLAIYGYHFRTICERYILK